MTWTGFWAGRDRRGRRRSGPALPLVIGGGSLRSGRLRLDLGAAGAVVAHLGHVPLARLRVGEEARDAIRDRLTLGSVLGEELADPCRGLDRLLLMERRG